MANKSIIIKNYSDIREEYTATAVAVIPGTLVELDTAGKVKAHATAGGNVLPMFAFEDELQGKGIDDTYLASDKVQVWIPTRGCQVLAILADDEDVSIGDFLESDGSGYLQKHASDNSAAPNITNQIVGVALEALDLLNSSAQSSASPLKWDRRIKVRIV